MFSLRVAATKRTRRMVAASIPQVITFFGVCYCSIKCPRFFSFPLSGGFALPLQTWSAAQRTLDAAARMARRTGGAFVFLLRSAQTFAAAASRARGFGTSMDILTEQRHSLFGASTQGFHRDQNAECLSQTAYVREAVLRNHLIDCARFNHRMDHSED